MLGGTLPFWSSACADTPPQPQEIFGKNQLPEKEDNKLLKLAAEFVQPMPLMIWAAIFIEARAVRGISVIPTGASIGSGVF